MVPAVSSDVSEGAGHHRARSRTDHRNSRNPRLCGSELMSLIDDCLIQTGSTLPTALEALDRNARGFLLVVDEAGRLCGTLTDGDIRRGLLRGASLSVGVEEVMRR